MAFHRVPNGVEIIIKGVMAGQQIVNTFYATKEGYSLADVQNLADDVDTWVHTTWKLLMPGNWTYSATTVRGLNAAVDVEAVGNTHAGDVGSLGNCPANNMALSVKRSSGFTGRAARGRIYVPVSDDVVETATNTVLDTFVTSLLTALDLLDGVVTADGFVNAIVHRVSGGVPLAEAVVYTLVEWVVVDKVLDSMRRRLPQRGV